MTGLELNLVISLVLIGALATLIGRTIEGIFWQHVLGWTTLGCLFLSIGVVIGAIFFT